MSLVALPTHASYPQNPSERRGPRADPNPGPGSAPVVYPGLRLHVTLTTTEHRADGDVDTRTAHVVEPGETVEHLMARLMRFGEFAGGFDFPEPPTATVEIRYVDGTLPPPHDDPPPF